MDVFEPLKDEDLIDLIQESHEKALKVLFQRYSPALFQFSKTIVKSESVADEVVSDIFMNLWLSRNTLSIRTSVKSYLFTSAKNQSLKYLRKKYPQLEYLEDLESKGAAPGHNPVDKEIHYQDLISQVEIILSQLPPQRRLVFRLHRIEGFSYQEIAEMLEISVKTVHNHMVQAIKQIARYYPQIETMLCLIFWSCI